MKNLNLSLKFRILMLIGTLIFCQSLLVWQAIYKSKNLLAGFKHVLIGALDNQHSLAI